MTAALVLWAHALASLLFGALALAAWRDPAAGWPRRAVTAALGLTALWALSVAGLGRIDVATRIVGVVRDLAWLVVAVGIARSLRVARQPAPLYLALAIVLAAAGVVASAQPTEGTSLAETWYALRMLGAMGGLLLVHQLVLAARGAARLLLVALAALWGAELLFFVVALLAPAAAEPVAALRGAMFAGIALLVAAAIQHGHDDAPALSRTAVVRSVGVLAVLAYAAGLALVAEQAGAAFGGDGRIAQTAVVFGGTAALLTLASSSWLRAWARVKLAKHLFRHRYDYRVEWQRFTATLGAPGAEPLGARIVRAVADLTDSPAGLLLHADEGALVSAAAWNWPDAPDLHDAALLPCLAGGRIVALDQPADDQCDLTIFAALPAAWIVVPLIHGDALAGAILLARPPIARTLDWEDLDLLRVAGRQAASYLAEDRAHRALAEEARFGEFNRRFAFLLHDIKNVASQLTLVARNAERHADNPAFRADMVETLRDGADRMAALLARLGEHDASRPEPSGAVDLAALARRIAARRRAQHPVEVIVEEEAFAEAQPGRLEQLLCHLVQNAGEASAPGQGVRIVVRREDALAVVDVVDMGAGMTAAFVRDELFRPFASTKPGGFGVGAYEARQLVRRMGGDIRVESRVGEGTRFTVRLPVAQPTASAHVMENAA